MSRHSVRDRERLVDRYLAAKAFVIESGFAAEIDWQDELRVEDVTEPIFLRELAWVVLSSGMRESVIRRCFPRFSSAFLDWSSASAIKRNRRTCIRHGFAVFGHAPKVRAIADAAARIFHEGFGSTKANLISRGITALEGFAYIGDVTVFHLAKNLGMDVVKPDRHLCRLGAAAGYAEPDSLCREICLAVGDRLSVVDLVLWRFATLRRDCCSFFAISARGRHGSTKRNSGWKAPTHRGERELSVLC